MKLMIDKKDTHTLLNIENKFSIEDIPHFESIIDEILSDGSEVIICDIQKLKVIDSSGIGAIVKAINRSKNKRAGFALINVTETILNIFKVAHLEKFLPILDTSEAESRFNIKI